ncbi:hypothetical protein OG497_37980 [Streptomyces sp. NBC_01242]|uniref:hypothetical protein n=1 Tax=Streptomyces sp. NBC_01242 TaxID=2903795 RepID=UPI0022577D57|nr:hypothetical protein [Streptomyces sp. NBC_01242]MCX4799649.1 hypothetical protein [Streptomyces sp. NBC_01242]
MTKPAKPADNKTRLRKIDTIDERDAVATYEAHRDGKVLGTITKFDEAAYKQTKKGTRDYRLITWGHSLDEGFGRDVYETRADCIESLELAAGVTS